MQSLSLYYFSDCYLGITAFTGENVFCYLVMKAYLLVSELTALDSYVLEIIYTLVLTSTQFFAVT